ncbi:MAG: LamG domain-containing protein [Candidatus Aenigmarchaeota archaeon]|nr:LamG domain-containing protein [Candidatus Aenigmarchaeota archaeon]
MNWVEVALSTFIFVAFFIFLLSIFTNKLSSRLEEMRFMELEKRIETLENLLNTYGKPENWNSSDDIVSFGLLQRIYYRVIVIDGEKNYRNPEIVSVAININEDCKKDISNESLRVYNQEMEEMPFIISEQNFCFGDKIKNATIVFFDYFNDTKKYFIYYSEGAARLDDFNLTSSLVAYWDFEDNQTIKDKTQNKNNGICFNTPLTEGKFGKALNFSENSFVNISESKNLNNSKISIEMWLKISDFTTATILEKQNSYGIALENERIKGYVEGLPKEYQPSYILEANKWYHIVFSSNGTTHKLYVNGEMQNATEYYSPIPLVDGPLTIGSDYNGANNFHGIIDEVRIYSSEIKDDEVKKYAYSYPLSIYIYPEIEDKAIDVNKVKSAKNMNLEEIKEFLAYTNFYVEVYDEGN